MRRGNVWRWLGLAFLVLGVLRFLFGNGALG